MWRVLTIIVLVEGAVRPLFPGNMQIFSIPPNIQRVSGGFFGLDGLTVFFLLNVSREAFAHQRTVVPTGKQPHHVCATLRGRTLNVMP